MPRKPRIQYPGAIYHVMSRGNRRENIFHDARDRELFLATLAECCQQTGWMIHSHVLMSNHFHLLVETPEANLSRGMQWFQGTYGQRFSRRHHLSGHVFQGRYKAPLLDPGDPEAVRRVSDYIHLNPARAFMLAKSRPVLARYGWSSFPYFIGRRSAVPAWLEVDRVFEAWGLDGSKSADRRMYRDRLELKTREIMRGEVSEEDEAAWQTLRRGWYIGDTSFRDQLIDRMEDAVRGRKKGSLGGRILREHDREAAERLLEGALGVLGLSQDQLQALPKGDVRKQGVAWLLKSQSTMTHAWVIEQLEMGSVSSLYLAVRRFREGDKGTKRLKQDLERLTI